MEKGTQLKKKKKLMVIWVANAMIRTSSLSYLIHPNITFNYALYAVCAQLCPTLCNPLNCSPPGSCVHGILQARILEWVAISCSRKSSQPWRWNQDLLWLLPCRQILYLLSQPWRHCFILLFPNSRIHNDSSSLPWLSRL